MCQPGAELARDGGLLSLAAWQALGAFDPQPACMCSLGEDGRLHALDRADRSAVVRWQPLSCWYSVLTEDDPRRDLLDLYLPISSATASRPIIVGHLGQ